jgi:hypothetical protein
VNCEILRRYDEVMSDKASKINVMELRNDVELNFSKNYLMIKLEERVNEL